MTITGIVLLLYGVLWGKTGGIISEYLNKLNLSIIGLILSLYLLLYEYFLLINIEDCVRIGENLNIDSFMVLIKIVMVISTILILFFSKDEYKRNSGAVYVSELSELLVFALIGMCIIISSADYIVLYLGIELLSLASYVLVCINRDSEYGTEAALKYFILGAMSSGIYLLGVVLIYFNTNTFAFIPENFNEVLSQSGLSPSLESGHVLGIILVLSGLLFKLGAAPFHIWIPDVYEGAPTIITAFIAITPKIAILGIIIKLFLSAFLPFIAYIQPLFIFAGLFSIFVGCLGGLNQGKLKRLLGYSAIGHTGFMVLGLSVGTLSGFHAALLYMLIYILMSVNTFALVLYRFSGSTSSRFLQDSPNFINDLAGFSRTQPVLAMTWALSLFSLAGIPPLGGFLGKLLVLLSGLEESLYIPMILAVIGTVISSFYYVRILRIMYFRSKFSDEIYKDLYFIASTPTSQNHYSFNSNSLSLSLSRSLILGFSLFLILTLLIYPGPFMLISFEEISKLML